MTNEMDFNPDPAELEFDCQQPLPELVIRGLEAFNAGHYFEAHEWLETAWKAEVRPIRELYRGILQVGVGFYHIEKNNILGGHHLFQRALGWLNPFPAVCQGIQVEPFRQQTVRIDTFLTQTLPNPNQAALKGLFFKIQYYISSIGDRHD
jgi:uncharacterized protein